MRHDMRGSLLYSTGGRKGCSITCEETNRNQHHDDDERESDELSDFPSPPVTPQSCPAHLEQHPAGKQSLRFCNNGSWRVADKDCKRPEVTAVAS